MTTIIRIILICPSCARDGEQFSLGSSNTFGWRQWSDGWGEGDCGPTQSSLRRCSACDTVFSQVIAKWRPRDSNESVPRFLGRSNEDQLVRPPVPTPPAGAKSTLFERMQRLSGGDRLSGRHQGSSLATDFEPLAASYAVGVDERMSARSAVIAGSWFDSGTEKALRTQWWWDWNSVSRSTAPTMIEAMADQSAIIAPIQLEMVENLERLIGLLEGDEEAMLCGEIRRRLGDFDEAIQFYLADRKAPEKWQQALTTLAEQHKTGLVELVT